jgi:hypothetical protein
MEYLNGLFVKLNALQQGLILTVVGVMMAAALSWSIKSAVSFNNHSRNYKLFLKKKENTIMELGRLDIFTLHFLSEVMRRICLIILCFCNLYISLAAISLNKEYGKYLDIPFLLIGLISSIIIFTSIFTIVNLSSKVSSFVSHYIRKQISSED